MELKLTRDQLLKPLQMVMGCVDHKPSLPILSHVLLEVDGQRLTLTATDTEIELTSFTTLASSFEKSSITLPAKMLVEVCRSLPEGAELNLRLDGEKMNIQSGRGKYSLATLPAERFPNHEHEAVIAESSIAPKIFKQLIDNTSFSMGVADVRYYLNGMLWQLESGVLSVVSSDGHRMSLDKCDIDYQGESRQVIVPRKGISELLKVLGDCEDNVIIKICENSIQVSGGAFEFTSKQIEATYPQYNKFIPLNNNKKFTVATQELMQLLSRMAVFTQDKQRTVRAEISENLLTVKSINQENDAAEEELTIDYTGEPVVLGFNVGYLRDILGVIGTEQVKFSFSNSNAGVVIEPEDEAMQSLYVVMPIRF